MMDYALNRSSNVSIADMLSHQSLYGIFWPCSIPRNLVFDHFTMQERQWRDYARRYDRRHGIKGDGEGLGAVTCNVTYDIQGRQLKQCTG